MKAKTTVASKNVTKTAAPPKVKPAKQQTPPKKKMKVQFEKAPEPVVLPEPRPEVSFEDDVLRILRENPRWKDDILRLSTDEIVLMGVRDIMSTSEHMLTTPSLTPRKKDMTDEEKASLVEMRVRRTTIIERVHSIVNNRLRRGFACQDEDWLMLVRNMVVVAVVGAEGMRGPFEFRSWMINVARTEGILDMEFVRRKNISAADFKLMIATCLFGFVLACRYVHLSVRESDVIPSMQRGNLLYVMRVLFGTFWSSGRDKRDADVLTLAAMMIASTMTEHALALLPAFLTEMAIPQAEWPMYVLHGYYPIAMYQHLSAAPTTHTSSE